MNPVTSSSATGSFMPDSPSSARASGLRRCEPRRTAKIAALSVAATAEPISSPSRVERSKSQTATKPVITAVIDRPDRRQRDRGAEHRPDLAPAGGQPALEQDQDQADRPQGPGQLGVVELDPADPLGAEQHAEAEEEQQARHPDPVGHLGGEQAGREQEAGDEDQLIVRQGTKVPGSARLVGEREPRLGLLGRGSAGRSPGSPARGRAAAAARSSAAPPRGSRPRSAAPRSSAPVRPQIRKPIAQPPQQPPPARARPRASAAWLSVVAAR